TTGDFVRNYHRPKHKILLHSAAQKEESTIFCIIWFANGRCCPRNDIHRDLWLVTPPVDRVPPVTKRYIERLRRTRIGRAKDHHPCRNRILRLHVFGCGRRGGATSPRLPCHPLKRIVTMATRPATKPRDLCQCGIECSFIDSGGGRFP